MLGQRIHLSARVCVQIQKKRSKDASKQVDLTATDALREQLRHIKATQFRGYEDMAGAGLVVAILQNGEMVPTAREGLSLNVAAASWPVRHPLPVLYNMCKDAICITMVCCLSPRG